MTLTGLLKLRTGPINPPKVLLVCRLSPWCEYEDFEIWCEFEDTKGRSWLVDGLSCKRTSLARARSKLEQPFLVVSFALGS